MVWIKIHTGDGLINDRAIERIFSRSPRRLKDSFEFYAEINGKHWPIYSMNLPEKIMTKAQLKSIKLGGDYHKEQEDIHERFLDVSADIYDEEDRILSAIMAVLIEAK